jgi:hypothetical protein
MRTLFPTGCQIGILCPAEGLISEDEWLLLMLTKLDTAFVND